MPTLAKMRKCVYPLPVYQATFSDGTTGRLSVWQPKGKPWDWERFRKVAGLCYGVQTEGYKRGVPGPVSPRQVVAGTLVHEGLNDPMGEASKPKRINSKAMVREVLKALDGGRWNPEAVAQARQWAA